ncbi:MAG: type VI secretion system protein TssA, partial [Phycisphaerae bacterium]|nr:type VI secretion system protein TssA [Phycisphaerae bacterium]
DVEVAAAFGLALFKRHGYPGLAAGLGLIEGLVTTFWDDLYPTRPRRRKARIESLPDRFGEGGWFGETPPGPDDFDAIDLCVSRIDAIKTALTEKMPDDPPDVLKFTRKIKELASQRPKPVEEAASPAASPAGTPVPPVGGASPAGAPVPAGEAFSAGEVADKSGAVNAVYTAASFLRKADPTDPIPYALMRVVKWSKISLPASDDAKFKIEPPEASVMDTLTHQFGKGLWENLLKNAEAAFRSNDPLWLDLQRYVCSAMRGLGSPYEKAEQAIIGLTGALVRRLGDSLFELKFRNGTPLCSGETKMWIESETAVEGGGGGGSAGTDNGRLAEASDQAKKLAASGKLKDGLKVLQEGLSTSTQRRDRFLWRLRIAQLCFDAQRPQLAGPLLEECYEEVKHFGVREWEPSLAVDAAATLYRCRKMVMASEKSPAPETLEKVRDSFAWLCQLDPLAALAAEPSGK